MKLLNHHDEEKAHQVDGGPEDDCPLVLGDPDEDEEEGDGGGEDDEGVGQDVEGEGGQPPQPGVGGPLQQRMVIIGLQTNNRRCFHIHGEGPY